MSYDVIEGDLLYLRQNAGDLHPYGCVATQTTSTSVDISLTGGSWYLVHAVYASSHGTYDEGGNQVGSRDVWGADCP